MATRKHQGPRDRYTDVVPNTKKAKVLELMKSTGITRLDIVAKTKVSPHSLGAMLASLQDMHGYDIRRFVTENPHHDPHNWRSRKFLISYRIVGRWNWDGVGYEDYLAE